MTDDAILIGPLETSLENRRVETTLELPWKRYHLYFQSENLPLNPCLEAVIPVGLILAMSLGIKRLVVHGEADRLFLANMPKLQDVFCRNNRWLSQVSIEGVTPRESAAPPGRRVGQFFSGGVDSFYTLIKNQSEITDLALIHGFDISLKQARLFEQVRASVNQVARAYEKNALVIESNLHDIMERNTRWIDIYGVLFGCLGNLLSLKFKRIYIAAGFSTPEEDIWVGSHPSADYLWGTSQLELIHDGTEASRIQKIALVAQSEVALKTLRVCYTSRNQAYNCGKCEKCVRTMVNLRIVGALDRCTTFNKPLDLRKLARMDLSGRHVSAFAMENLRAVEEKGDDPELAKALRKGMDGSRWQVRWAKRLRRLRAKALRRRRFGLY